MVVFVFKQKTAYEMRISDWSSDVCSSDLPGRAGDGGRRAGLHRAAAGAVLPADLHRRPGALRLDPAVPGDDAVLRVLLLLERHDALSGKPGVPRPYAGTAGWPRYAGRLSQQTLGRASCRGRVCPHESIPV